jgi:hypothetical protein
MSKGEKTGERHPPLVQVEPNIEEWPVFQLGRSKSNSAVVERTVQGEDGSSLKQRMEISAPGKYRLPGRFDYDVYSAVLELLEIRGGIPESGALGFSLHELILLMDLEPSGRTYEEVKRSLRRIAATVLESDNAFWSNGAKRHISDTFRLWDVTFDAVTDKNGYGSRHRIEFGKLFKRSFEERYLRGLDIEFYWGLDSPVAKRLYRLVDLKRAGAAVWSTDLFELQKQIPIGPYAYVSKVKEKLKAAHEELIERGFLSGVSYQGRSKVLYEVSEAFRTRRKGLELVGTKEEIVAIQLLTRSGLRGDVARDLVAKHGPPHCTRCANALPYQKNLRNPAGWLRKAIEHGYELPDTRPLSDTPAGASSASLLAERDNAHLSPVAEDPNAMSQDIQPKTLAPLAADSQAQAIWDPLLKELTKDSNAPSSTVWFEGVVPTKFEDSTLVLHVPNMFVLEYIETRFGERLRSALTEQVGPAAKLVVQAADDARSTDDTLPGRDTS